MSSDSDGFHFGPFAALAGSLVVWGALHFLTEPSLILSITASLAASIAISIVIWQACDPFADAAQWVGQRFRIPGSVRGATLDAIASSMPELYTGIFFVIVALSIDKGDPARLQASIDGFGATIATCAGSSIYNMILIPAICAITISFVRRHKPAIEVDDEVLHRDGAWAIGAQFGLLLILCLPSLAWWMGVIPILAYCAYIIHLYRDARRYQSQTDDVELEGRSNANQIDDNEADDEADDDDSTSFLFNLFSLKLNGLTSTLVLLTSTLVAAAACYFLVEVTVSTAESLEVDTFFVAVILAAAVSSIPDTFMSLGAARRGDDSGAVSNAFGSNIFDICIGMSIPLLVTCYLNDWMPIPLADESGHPLAGVIGLRILLLVLTIVTMALIWWRKRVTRRIGFALCGLYCLFILYAIVGSLELIPL